MGKGAGKAPAAVKPTTGPAGPAGKGMRPASPAGIRPATPVAPAQGVKRPASPAPVVAAKKPAVAVAAGTAAAAKAVEVPKLTVTTQSHRKDEIGIQTLLGDYTEIGVNHGRKYYQKMQAIPGHAEIKVFLYWWDDRDGKEFSGWWFGDKLGGTQVWARCPTPSVMPPRVGWLIPWDAQKAEPGILAVDSYKAPAAGPGPAVVKPGVKSAVAAGPTAPTTAPPASPSDADPRVKKATLTVETATKTAEKELAKFKPMATDKATETVLKSCQEGLTKQNTALLEVIKTVTDEIAAVRKAGGATANTVATELTKLSTKLRSVQVSVNTEVSKLKPLLLKAGVTAAKSKEEEAKKEVSDLSDFEASQGTVTKLVEAAEEAVESISATTAPLLAEPPEGEILTKVLEEIEASAKDAQTKINDARKEVSAKLVSAKNYAPETRKKAVEHYTSLQNKLTEGQKQVTAFKTFKKDFPARSAARKALQDIADKIALADLDVEKAAVMTGSEMSEEEVQAVEKVLSPAQSSLLAAIGLIDKKVPTSDAVTKDELASLKAKANASRAKGQKTTTALKDQRQAIGAKQAIVEAAAKLDKVEKALIKCQDAEMPFLKGIEVLPKEESDQALSESDAAAAETDKELKAAQAFLKAKIADAKKFTSKELAKSCEDELQQVQARADTAAKKLASFSKETAERKLGALMAGVMDSIRDAEKAVEAYTEVTKPLSEKLEDVTIEVLKSSSEKAAEVEKEAIKVLAEARKVIQSKQKEAKGNEAQSALGKLTSKINNAQAELQKHKKLVQSADKLISGKQVVATEEARVAQAEADVEKFEKAGTELSDDAALELGTGIRTTQAALKTSAGAVEAALAGTTPALKALLQPLLDRNKAAVAKLVKVLADTKDQRERVLVESYVQEAMKQGAAVDAAIEQVGEAELPFLKGIEVLPLEEATATIEESEKAAGAVQTAIAEARTYAAAKNVELKAFSKEVTKAWTEEAERLMERVNSASTKLTAFRKDTDGRRKNAQVQELGVKLDATEAAVKALAEGVEPLTKDGDAQLSNEEASALCDKVADSAKAAQVKLDECRNLLTARQKDAKAMTSLAAPLQLHSTRLAEITKDLAKARKVHSDHEQKFVASKLLKEAAAQLEALEAAVVVATEAAKPLVELKGEQFLVANSIERLASALRGEMKAKGLDQEGLFKEIGGKGKGVKDSVFLTYLAKLPDTTGKEELAFSEERRAAIFKSLDVDGDGHVSLAEFKGAFKQQFKCIQSISITDALDISKSKTIGKLEPKDIVDGLGEPTTDEASSMLRLECRSGDKTGFVTMKGNGGTLFLEPWTQFTVFCNELDAVVAAQNKEVIRVSTFMKMKSAEVAKNANAGGPLADARTELNKFGPKVTAAQKSLEQLKSKIAMEKKAYAVREQAEKTAHIEARERKLAEELMGDSATAVEALEADGKKLEEAAAPMVSLQGAEREAFAKPASLLEEVEKLLAALRASATKAKADIKDKLAALPAPPTAPGMRAKPELLKLQAKVEAQLRKSSLTVDAVRKACAAIVGSKLGAVATALRQDLQKRGLTLEKFFLELAQKGDAVPEKAFVAKLKSLEGLDLSEEVALLVSRRIEAGSICRRKFMAFLEQYYTVVKAIAMTDDFDIGKAKTLRKAELEEVFEMLEGPKSDDKLNMTRIRARSLLDSLEGWISVQGNQGTPFLKEVEKPFYSCNVEVPLEKSLKGDEVVRSLLADEVLELIEGPRKQAFSGVVRVRAKAVSDNAIGWLTVKDKNETTFAEADSKFYVCTGSIAITDDKDIKTSKALRKLEVGEVFVAIGEPVSEEENGTTRIQAKFRKDELVGWVTLKGNAGTVFAEVSSKHYNVLQEVPLQDKFPSTGAKDVRTLAKGELLEVLEGPKTETTSPEVRARCRAVSDGAEGWVTVKPTAVRKWGPLYRCTAVTTLHEGKDCATVVRQLDLNENVELLEGPCVEGKALRMRCRSKKDNTEGWVFIRDADGKKFMS